MGKLQYADPLLRDGKLLVDLGFNLSHVAQRQSEDRSVLHRDTLRNHYKRVPVREAQRAFYEEHLWHLRHRKWLRKGLYAADTFTIEVAPDATSYQLSFHEFKDGKTKEESKIQGYKVCFLLNLKEDRERVVGVSIGPVNANSQSLRMTGCCCC